MTGRRQPSLGLGLKKKNPRESVISGLGGGRGVTHSEIHKDGRVAWSAGAGECARRVLGFEDDGLERAACYVAGRSL